jgi:flagellar basal-body rod protein FlgB
MLIGDIFQGGGMQSLGMTVRFAGARQRLIAHNVANLDTPNFRPVDVSPKTFQAALGRAIDERRQRTGGEVGELRMKAGEINIDRDGRMTLNPTSPSGNILFHDKNNRDLERLMQANAENAQTFRIASDLLRTRFDVLRAAISERV